MDVRPVPVGIAVVEEGNSFLVGIRSPRSTLPGRAEFPGGKCRPGESAAQCALRECREETGLSVEIEHLLLRRMFEYEHGTLDLSFFACRLSRPEDRRADHLGFCWVPRAELHRYDFPPANAPLLQLLGDAATRPETER